jgi:predicted transcriptional regulator
MGTADQGDPTISTTEATPKKRMLEIIHEQPDDSSYEEILRELAFARMVERGLADSESGRTISNKEMRERIDSWAK